MWFSSAQSADVSLSKDTSAIAKKGLAAVSCSSYGVNYIRYAID
jgi:hypothetical protein